MVQLVNTTNESEYVDSIIHSYLRHRNKLFEESQGRFSETRKNAIWNEHELELNEASAEIASRGLATSGAGKAALADIKERILLQEQKNAKQELYQVDTIIISAIQSRYLRDLATKNNVGTPTQNTTE